MSIINFHTTTKKLFQTLLPAYWNWRSSCSSSRTFGRNMPKKKTGQAGKEQTGQHGKVVSSTTTVIKGPVNVTKDGDLAISIQVKPGAKINAITDVSEEAVSVQISAPPVDGEANIAIVKYFAEVLNLKKADVSLKGGKSRQKTVTINSSTELTIEKTLDILRNQQNK